MKTHAIRGIVNRHRRGRGGLISVLEDVQAEYGYLPADALQIVSRETRRPLVDVYGVATFYRSFSMEPRGKHLCSVCMGTACHVRGAPTVADEFEEQLDVRAGSTTTDGEFTLTSVNCLGACALGPVVVIDGYYFSNVAPAGVEDVIERARSGLTSDGGLTDAQPLVVAVSCPRCNHSLMDPLHAVDGLPSIRVTASSNSRHGWLRLSAVWGSYKVESEFPVRSGTTVDFFCPHCHAALKSASMCPLCRASMVSMLVPAGGIAQICSRRGCKGHMLDLISGDGHRD
ncbi:MAG: NADH-quinone oxidoreductase subunit NuoE family protein [Planctomycetota bacterium]|jgi:NADH-quinone oxidoreductase subunit E